MFMLRWTPISSSPMCPMCDSAFKSSPCSLYPLQWQTKLPIYSPSSAQCLSSFSPLLENDITCNGTCLKSQDAHCTLHRGQTKVNNPLLIPANRDTQRERHTQREIKRYKDTLIDRKRVKNKKDQQKQGRHVGRKLAKERKTQIKTDRQRQEVH